jgi:Glycosyltransferase family 87
MNRAAIIGLVIFPLLGLLGYSTYHNWIHEIRTYHLPRTTTVKPEISALDAPLELGSLAGANSDIEFDLDLEFRAVDDSNHPNLLQTDDLNNGLRIEITGKTIALISSSTNRPAEPDGLVFSTALEIGRWYRFRLSALSQGSVRIQLADDHPIVLNRRSFKANNVRIGIGFDNERRFSGDIRGLRIIYGPARSANEILLLPALAGGFLYAWCLFLYRQKLRSTFEQAYKIIINSSKTLKIGDLRSFLLPRSGAGSNLQNPDIETRRTIYCTVVAYGFVASVLWHFMAGMFYGVPTPWNSFLPAPISRFSDFYQIHSDWVRFHFGGVAYGLLYFPSTYLLVDPFTFFPTAYVAVAVFLAICCTFFAWYSYISLKSDNGWATARDMLLGCFLSYPFIFLVHTANLEFFVAMFVALFFFFYQRQQFRVAGFFLAFAISMKLMPGVFLVLLVSDRRYRMILSILAWITLLSLASLLIFEGGIRDGLSSYLSNFNQSQRMYFDLMVMRGDGNNFGHSLLNGARVLFPGAFPDMSPVLMPYAAFAAITFSIVSYLVVMRETEFWRKICLLTLCLDLLPYTSTDYKLIYPVLAAYLFINKRAAEPSDPYVAILFGLIVIPKGYFTIGSIAYKTVGIAATPALMTVLLAWLIFTSPRSLRSLSRQKTKNESEHRSSEANEMSIVRQR